jgi:hypothetical protein
VADASSDRKTGADASAEDAADAAKRRPDAHDVAPTDAGVPYLVKLAVTVAPDAASALQMVPQFSPTTFDYYVRCAPGSNAMTVSMTASPGAESALLEPATSPASPSQTLSLAVTEGQAVVAAATRGAASVEYWVRCLPADFPAYDWTPHPDAGAPTPGYYLLGTMVTPPSSGGYAMALDRNGVPVWYASHEGEVYDVESIVDGGISYAYPFKVYELSPPETTDITAAGAQVDLHELRALPGGHYLAFSGVPQMGVDLTGLTLPLPDGGVTAYGPNTTIVSCTVLEVDAAGNVVWQWAATDHFDPVAGMTYRPPATPNFPIDVFHCNAIDVDPTNGNLLVSARNMDSVFYVERPSGRVVWKMGGTPDSKDGASYISVADPFFRQHDARLLPGWSSTCAGGSGQISLFDDETDAPGVARGVVYDVNVIAGEGGALEAGTNADCGAFDAGMAPDGGAPDGGRATVAWQYKGTVATEDVGSFRVLVDGSHTIGWGQGAVPMTGLIFSEVDEQGHDLLDLVSPDGMVSYRAVKVPLTAFSLNALRSAAGH